MEYWSDLKRDELSYHEKIWRALKCVWPSERSPSENPKSICCMILTIWPSGKDKTSVRIKKVSGCQGLRGGINTRRTGEIYGSEATLHDTAVVNTCQCTFVNTHRIYNTKSKPWCKLLLWLIKSKTKGVRMYGEGRQKNIGACLLCQGLSRG